MKNDEKHSSHHKSPGQSSRTPVKSKSKLNLTVEKYLNAKLEYSEKKKVSAERMLLSKDDRIRQLEA